jgi:hypothetical protein
VHARLHDGRAKRRRLAQERIIFGRGGREFAWEKEEKGERHWYRHGPEAAGSVLRYEKEVKGADQNQDLLALPCAPEAQLL